MFLAGASSALTSFPFGVERRFQPKAKQNFAAYAHAHHRESSNHTLEETISSKVRTPAKKAIHAVRRRYKLPIIQSGVPHETQDIFKADPPTSRSHHM